MEEERKCAWILKDGSKCSAYKQKNSQYCFKHNQSPEERSLMAQQGGMSGKALVGFGKRISIEKPRHIRKCLVNALNALKNGEIEPVVANSIAYICGVIIKNMELIEMEERLREIESKLGLKNSEGIGSDKGIFNKGLG